jgi:hypothetical protein
MLSQKSGPRAVLEGFLQRSIYSQSSFPFHLVAGIHFLPLTSKSMLSATQLLTHTLTSAYSGYGSGLVLNDLGVTRGNPYSLDIESYDLPLEAELDVEWEVHGLQLIELFPEYKGWDVESWPYPVFGMRYILPCVTGFLQDGISKVLIRDLSPRQCLRASKEQRKESGALYEATAWPTASGSRLCKPNRARS